MINLGNKKVSKLLVGSNVIYQDSDGWIPLELPDGVSGQAFFKDNDDGTASLSGVLNFDYVQHQAVTLISPPAGYAFDDLDWSAGKSGGYINGVCYVNSLLGQVAPSTGILRAKIYAGNICSSELDTTTSNMNKTVLLTKNSTVERSADSGPAIVGIKKV